MDKTELLILKQFKNFIRNGFNVKYFTKRLYEFFTLKCGFIAYFDLNGFYNTYFTNIHNIEKFSNKLYKNNPIKNTLFKRMINELRIFLN